jgi:hypothetical protein
VWRAAGVWRAGDPCRSRECQDNNPAPSADPAAAIRRSAGSLKRAQDGCCSRLTLISGPALAGFKLRVRRLLRPREPREGASCAASLLRLDAGRASSGSSGAGIQCVGSSSILSAIHGHPPGSVKAPPFADVPAALLRAEEKVSGVGFRPECRDRLRARWLLSRSNKSVQYRPTRRGLRIPWQFVHVGLPQSADRSAEFGRAKGARTRAVQPFARGTTRRWPMPIVVR